MDEYDSYIAPVYRVLVGSRSEGDLVDLLSRLEQELMGRSRRSADYLRPVALRLLTLDVRV